jgi:hypothetical protein
MGLIEMQRRQFLEALAVSPLLMSAMARAATPFDAAPAVRVLAQQARALYQDAAIGVAIANQLLAALRAGRFAIAGSPDQLANLLNEEIADASHDAHFVVMFGSMGNPPVPPTPPHQDPPLLSAAELQYLGDNNFGIAATTVLPGNIGRIEIRQFYRPVAQLRAKIAHAMSFLADSSAMIVDLTDCPGGDPKAVAHFSSYFFDRPPFILNRFHWRNRPVEEFRTEPVAGSLGYGEQRPVIVRISRASFSAAEEFAYNMQALKRAVVVGQTSGGGANHALPVEIPGGFTAFIPQARAENPITGTNWEGIGVRPDIAADDASSARTAYRTALEHVSSSADKHRAGLARTVLAEL